MSKKGKMQKKNLNRVNNNDVVGMGTALDELKKLFIILISIVGIICVFYIITAVITKNNGKLKYFNNDEISQISYTDILASDILNKNGAYYVFVNDTEDVNEDLYVDVLAAYSSKDASLSIYYVDLYDALNQDYVGTENSFSSSDLKFKESCLLKIVDGRIVDTYTGKDSIIGHIKSLIEA